VGNFNVDVIGMLSIGMVWERVIGGIVFSFICNRIGPFHPYLLPFPLGIYLLWVRAAYGIETAVEFQVNLQNFILALGEDTLRQIRAVTSGFECLELIV
jgi:hypothetical protein